MTKPRIRVRFGRNCPAGRSHERASFRGVVLASEHGPTVYLTLTLRLSEEAVDTPTIEVLRAVRNAAISLAASRGDDPDPAEVMKQARRRLGLTG